ARRFVIVRTTCRTQVSAFERLRDLPALFRGGDLTRQFGWTSKTASQYLYLWKRRGLVQGLGGHSDVYANLLADRRPDWDRAVVIAMPSAVLIGIEALRRAGWTTQLVQRPTIAVKSGHPAFKTEHFDVVNLAPHWFDQVTPGIEGSPDEGLRTLRLCRTTTPAAAPPGKGLTSGAADLAMLVNGPGAQVDLEESQRCVGIHA